MTVTVQFKRVKRRWEPNMLFETDIDDEGAITLDYSGEIGADSVNTIATTTSDVTAGSPTITLNSVAIPLSGFKEGIAKMEVQMTTAAGNVLSNKVSFRAIDYYNT